MIVLIAIIWLQFIVMVFNHYQHNEHEVGDMKFLPSALCNFPNLLTVFSLIKFLIVLDASAASRLYERNAFENSLEKH